MRPIVRLMFALLCLVPARVAAQYPADDRRGMSTYPYGYEYSPWRASPWSAMDYRTKCEGEQIRGMDTGPIKWMIEFRNQTADLLSFDYIILPPGQNKHPAAKGRAKAKPGKTASRLAIVSTTRCDDGIVIQFENLRVGADADSVPYRKPDRAS
jgi:hypothetical protein